jgi:hypothetical protein
MPSQKITSTPRPPSAIRRMRKQRKLNNTLKLNKARKSKKKANNLLTLVESRPLNSSVIKTVQNGLNKLIMDSPNPGTARLYTKMKNTLTKLNKSRSKRKNKNNFYHVTNRNLQ